MQGAMSPKDELQGNDSKFKDDNALGSAKDGDFGNDDPMKRDPERTQTPEESEDKPEFVSTTTPSTTKITDSKMRRHLHIRSEQRRREKIIDGFSKLKTLIPTIENENESKSSILKKTIDYIYYLQDQNQNLLLNFENLKDYNASLQQAIANGTSNYVQNNSMDSLNQPQVHSQHSTTHSPNAIHAPFTTYPMPRGSLVHQQPQPPPPPPPQQVSQGPPPGPPPHRATSQSVYFMPQHITQSSTDVRMSDAQHMVPQGQSNQNQNQPQRGQSQQNQQQGQQPPMQHYYYTNSNVYEPHPSTQVQQQAPVQAQSQVQTHYQVPVSYGITPQQQQQVRDSSSFLLPMSSPSIITNPGRPEVATSSKGLSGLPEPSQISIRPSLPSLQSLINNEQVVEVAGSTSSGATTGPAFVHSSSNNIVTQGKHILRGSLASYSVAPRQSPGNELKKDDYRFAYEETSNQNLLPYPPPLPPPPPTE